MFDDGLVANRGEAREMVKGTICSVTGNKALWKKGVSGTALAFDGYFSKVELPKAKAPALTNELTVEAWVALGAYPWNDAGIVHCSAGSPIGPEDYKHGYRDPYTYRPWKMEGYMLGVDPYGRPIFKLNGQQVGGGVLESKDTVPARDMLPTYRWTHLAGTYGNGRMCLYIDGRLVVSEPASGRVVLPDRNTLIGLNGDAQRVSDPVSHSKRAANNNLPLVYGIEGLIDEVRIHAQSLSGEEIRGSFEAFCPPPAAVTGPDLERRILPGTVTGQPAAKFGASCETLKFHELWDNLWRPDPYRDIVVRFDTLPGRVVFWQGINFGSGWVTENNKWMADQSWEIGGPHGCAEHMADKRGRFNHVRLIENTDARVVVHWRYPCVDVGYVSGGPGNWTDEYHTIYHALHNFCAIDLSALYLDILKDRLYTSPAGSLERRSAQTVLTALLDALARIMAPILPVTAEEVWRHMPAAPGKAASIHMALLPAPDAALMDAGLAERWERLLQVRGEVTKALEEARVKKLIGHALDAAVTLSAGGELYEALAPHAAELRSLFIVSAAELLKDAALEGAVESTEVKGLRIRVEPAAGLKCERCWVHETSVGESAEHPGICGRCRTALGVQSHRV